MQERDIMKAFDGITPDNELKEKVLEAIENHKPRKFNWDFSRIVPVALCAVVLINGFILYKSLPEKNNSVIPLDLSSANISNSMVVDITTTSIPVTKTTTEPVIEKKLNVDLISDIGLTYSQLQERYGKLMFAFNKSGGKFYWFENGSGSYGWSGEGHSIDYEGEGLLPDEIFSLLWFEGDGYLKKEAVLLPKSKSKCVEIVDLQATDIFIGLEQPATLSEIEESYNIEFEEVYSNIDEESGKYMGPITYRNKAGEIFRYSIELIYEGKSIIIEMLNEEIISLDSYVKIRYKVEDDVTVSETVAETTQTQEETTVVTETTTEPMIEKKLNWDLLSDIGLTYEEIKAKRGETTQRVEVEGGYGYIFEKGYGKYGWSVEEMVVNNNEVIKPKEFAKCTTIDKVSVRDLFLGLPNSITPLEMEEMFGVKYKNTQDAGYTHYGWENYISSFSYNDIDFIIYTKEKDKIDLDSYIFLKMEN